MNITGVMVQYYKACKRELWFFANQINMNYGDENILLGRQIHKESYSRESKNIQFGNISFDFVEKSGEIEIYEIKKSSKLKEPAKYQLYYYLWNVKKFGKTIKGFVVYPKEKRREELALTPEIEGEIEKIMEEIPKIAEQSHPPSAVKKPYCRRCSYFELCMV